MDCRWRGLGRALALLLASCGLSACVAQQGPLGYGRAAPIGGAYASAPPTVVPAPAGRRVAVLVPLSGPNAELGRSMLQAAHLAFDNAADTAFDTKDTKGTPEGAAAAATEATAAGAGIIVGPLTAAETGAVAPVATARGLPVLAFTSDTSKAQPGVWALGLSPGQQVRTLVRGAAADNKRRIAAVLPSNPFGDSLADGLQSATAEAGLPPPTILRYSAQAGLDSALQQLGAPPGAPPAAPPGAPPGAPPAIDALLLGTAADTTLAILPALTQLGLGPDKIRLLGTTLWARDTARLAPLAGAWFAGPPANTLKVFQDSYTARFGAPPRDFASLAFDAAGAARAAAGPGGVDVNVLLNPLGFAGANGVFVLLPDGRVRRSLALFEIGPGGVRTRDTPPESAPAAM